MNYYSRHLGDYARDTAHLTMLEHGAYGLLLDRYYATEQGIPAEQAYRLTRARSKEERAAVDAVLAEFFTLTDGAWVNRRCEEEIGRTQTKVKAAQENGRRGGRPKKEAEETEQKPSGFSLGSTSETQTKALQSPITNNQEPPTPSTGEPDPPGFAEFWEAWPTSPRKVARKQCAAKWRRGKFGAIAEEIRSHVDAMKSTRQWSEGFEPAPLTYLNGERWRDGTPADSSSARGAFEGVL